MKLSVARHDDERRRVTTAVPADATEEGFAAATATALVSGYVPLPFIS